VGDAAWFGWGVRPSVESSTRSSGSPTGTRGLRRPLIDVRGLQRCCGGRLKLTIRHIVLSFRGSCRGCGGRPDQREWATRYHRGSFGRCCCRDYNENQPESTRGGDGRRWGSFQHAVGFHHIVFSFRAAVWAPNLHHLRPKFRASLKHLHENIGISHLLEQRFLVQMP
jgi:hypothetical protein